MKPARAEKKPRSNVDGNINSGFPSPAEDYEEPPLDLHDLVVKNPPATFFMRADTDEMSHSGLQRGDILTVDRSILPKSGLLLVAVIDGTFQVKRCVMAAQRMVVADDYGSMNVSPDNVWGVVTYITRKV